MFFPNPNVTSGFEDILTYSNTVTNNTFVFGILIAVFLILFIGLKTRGFASEKAFASAIFSTTLVTYIMVLIPNFLSPEIIVIMTLLSAVSMVILYKTSG